MFPRPSVEWHDDYTLGKHAAEGHPDGGQTHTQLLWPPSRAPATEFLTTWSSSRAKHDGDNSCRRDILWEGVPLPTMPTLSYPKSFGPLTTLPCGAQCNIEISQGGIASAPTSQRALAFAALTANIPAAGGRDSLNLSQRHPPYRSECLPAFQQVCRHAHLPAPPTRPSRTGLAATHPFSKKHCERSSRLSARLCTGTRVLWPTHRRHAIQLPRAQIGIHSRHAGRSQAMVGGRAGLP